MIAREFRQADFELLVPEVKVSPSLFGYVDNLALLGPCLTVEDGGAVLMCTGVVPIFDGYGYLWSALAPETGLKMVGVHRIAVRFLDTLNLRRIEATVEVGFAAGIKWMEMLGFECEAPRMRKYGPNGEDHMLFARCQ